MCAILRRLIHRLKLLDDLFGMLSRDHVGHQTSSPPDEACQNMLLPKRSGTELLIGLGHQPLVCRDDPILHAFVRFNLRVTRRSEIGIQVGCGETFFRRLNEVIDLADNFIRSWRQVGKGQNDRGLDNGGQFRLSLTKLGRETYKLLSNMATFASRPTFSILDSAMAHLPRLSASLSSFAEFVFPRRYQVGPTLALFGLPSGQRTYPTGANAD
jgi:hypothetical protein